METNKHVRVLLVDDDEDDFILAKNLLTRIPHQQFTMDWVSSYDSAIKQIETEQHDVYLIDYRLGPNTGVDVLNEAIRMGCKQPIIMLTGKGDQRIDFEAMKLGAADYLVKDKIDSFILERSIRYALERVNAVKAMKESELKYKNIFEKSRDVIYIADKQGQFLDINQSAIRLFGYSKEELMHLRLKQLFAEEEQWKTFEEQLLKKGEVHELEVVLLNKKGDKIFCILTADIQQVQKGTAQIINGIIHDITKRKKAEQELMNIEKLAVTGRIARTIAHEVRNPLTNVNLSVEQLRNDLKTNDDTITIYFDIITRNCERINQLITELLDSAKPAQLQIGKHSINALLDETLELASDRIKLKDIAVKKHFSKEIPDVSIDKEKVKIAFLNIIINAVEAMEAHKGILQIETAVKGNKCVIHIIDNGVGISKENMNKLFEPFFSGKPKGMGLGLTASQNIILNHKGSIEVESELDKGTRFVISFDLTL